MWQWAVTVCVGTMYGCMSLVLCARLCAEMYASPVTASEQEPQNFASSLVLFFRKKAAVDKYTGVRKICLHNCTVCVY